MLGPITAGLSPALTGETDKLTEAEQIIIAVIILCSFEGVAAGFVS